ncbi:hypothetical protein [Ralstonia psammae]|nr:hypothetical protein [Ralstonia sp. LMG 19083]
MSLLRTFLPEHQFSEQHHIRVNAPPARVLDMVSQLDINDFPLARLFLRLRAIPARIAAVVGKPSARRIDAGFGLHDFTVLGRDGDREFALGLVGRFWESAGGLIRVEAGAFRTFSEPDIAKLVMTFVAEPDGADTLLTTRTCVHCAGTTALRRFTPYWVLIRIPSGLIRRMLLQRIKQLAEAYDAPLTRPE